MPEPLVWGVIMSSKGCRVMLPVFEWNLPAFVPSYLETLVPSWFYFDKRRVSPGIKCSLSNLMNQKYYSRSIGLNYFFILTYRRLTFS